MKLPAVSLIVPCYNEEAGLPYLLARLRRMHQQAAADWEIILVNDGSADRTAELAEQAAELDPWIRVVHHKGNKGLGASLRTGFAHTRAPIICTMDSDCTFAPEKLPELVELVRGGVDIATASPWHPQSEKGDVHPARAILSRGASAVYKVILGTEIHSFTPLHRAYRRAVWERVRFESNGFSAVAELLVRSLFEGFRVCEVPMRLDKREHGESKINIFSSILSHLNLMRLSARLAFGGWITRRLAIARLAINQ